MSPRIEDYALIGDCETAALVSRDGSIDWLCWPRFDSGACFAALLGTPENGRWRLAPADERARSTRRYRGDTLILETDFETADGGAVTVIDFMPLRGAHGARDPLRLRGHRAVGHPARRRVAPRDRRAGHAAPAHRRRAAWRGAHPRGRVRGGRGGARVVRAHVRPLPPAAARAGGAGGGA